MTEAPTRNSTQDNVADDTADDTLMARHATWNIEPLVDNKGEQGVKELLEKADELVTRLEIHKNKVQTFDSSSLYSFMTQAADMQTALSLASSYAMLHHSADTTDEARGALVQHVQERATEISARLIFFELEWVALETKHAAGLIAAENLAFCRHYLVSLGRYRDHLLSEPEERILQEKSITGADAWQRLFGELSATITVELPHEQTSHDTSHDTGHNTRTASLEEGLSRLHATDRSIRQAAAQAVTKGLAPGLRTRAFLFNTILADRAIDDRLQHYDNWLQRRNLSNEASDESVRTLIEAVQNRYDIPQRWYTLKARLLGLDRLADYDRMASVATTETRMDWDTAQELVLDAYASFSTELSDLARRFFVEKWIDAPIRPGKRPGAFCAYTDPSHHPYVFLNWAGKRNDALTLAHELGHGLHACLAAPQGVFHQNTPLTLAETASVFGETVTFNRLLSTTNDPNEQLELLAESLDGAIATVFRQTAMNRFEDAVHTTRRTEGELSVERFNELWEETQTSLFGKSVEVTAGYRTWWSYIPHFISTPGYVYAYAYGQLLALAVYQNYRKEGAGFVPRYLDLLRAGGSMPPEELGKIVGCDLSDPGFWNGGLEIIDAQITAAEKAAHAAGRLLEERK